MNIRITTITRTFRTGLGLLPDAICSEYDIRLELCSWLIVMVLVRIIELCCDYLVSGYSGKKRPRSIGSISLRIVRVFCLSRPVRRTHSNDWPDNLIRTFQCKQQFT